MKCLLIKRCTIYKKYPIPIVLLILTIKLLKVFCRFNLPRICIKPQMIHRYIGDRAVCITVIPVMSSKYFLMPRMRLSVIICIFCAKSCLFMACTVQICSAGSCCFFPEVPVLLISPLGKKFIKMRQMV